MLRFDPIQAHWIGLVLEILLFVLFVHLTFCLIGTNQSQSLANTLEMLDALRELF